MRRAAYLVALATAVLASVPLTGLANGVTPGAAIPSTPAAVGAGPVPVVEYSTNQLIPLTVTEAWELSGRNQARFGQMVQQLAEVSARNRGVVLPDTTAAGTEIGQLINDKIKANPNQLLYSVVDSAIVDYKARHSVPAGTGAGPPMISYSANQLLPLTVAQAWQLAGGDSDSFARMVRTLTEVSAEKRDFEIQDAATAGTEFGQLVRQKAEADPNQLLYVVVDSSLVEYHARHIPAGTP